MAIRLSRRKITSHVAQQLVDGVPAGQLILQLAAYLVDNRRTNEVSLIVRDIEYELSSRGVVMATITSAYELAESTRQAVTKLIQDKTTAHQVHLHQLIDPDVLGGVKIDLPGLQLDATLSHTLTTLKANYKK